MSENAKPWTGERRFKVMWVSAEILLNLRFFGGWHKCNVVEIATCDLPEDVRVLDVIYDWDRRAFGFRIYHDSFEVVEDCHQCPTIWPMFNLERFEVAQQTSAKLSALDVQTMFARIQENVGDNTILVPVKERRGPEFL